MTPRLATVLIICITPFVLVLPMVVALGWLIDALSWLWLWAARAVLTWFVLLGVI